MGNERMVKESDLIAVKKASAKNEQALKAQVDELTRRVAAEQTARRQAESQIQILRANAADDEEVKKIRDYLLSEDTRLSTEREKYDKDVTALKDRERKVRAGEIASDLKSKGVEFDMETLQNAEDIEKFSHDLYVEHLAKENEELKKAKETPQEPQNPAESVVERGTGGLVKKGVWAQSDKEFDQTYETMRQEALSKK